MISQDDFSVIYSRLITVFGEYSKNAAGKCAIYHEKLCHLESDLLIRVIDQATSTCKRFPTIAELKEIARQFQPEESSGYTDHESDVADFNRRLRVCKDIMAVVQDLPEDKRTIIENRANSNLSLNAPDWYTTEIKKRAFQGFCILAFRNLYPDWAADIEAASHANNQVITYKPIPFTPNNLQTPNIEFM